MPERAVPRSVHVLTASLAVAAAGFAAASGVARTGPGWVVVAALAVMIVAGLMELQFEYRGHVEALDLFEAALMPAIIIVPGVGAVVLAAAAKAVSQRLMGIPAVKATFNVAQWSLAAAITTFVFVQADGPHRHGGGQMVALALAMVAGIVVNHLSVAAVLALVDQHSLREVLAGLVSAIVAGWLAGGVVNISFGLLFAGVAATTPVAFPLFVVPLVVLHWASRGYAEVRVDRERLRSLQRATHELTAPADTADALRCFLDAVRTSFESSAVDVVLVRGADRHVHHSGDVDTRALTSEIVSSLTTTRGAARVAAGDGSTIGDLLAANDRRVCLYAPLRQGAKFNGWLVSYDRSGFEGFEAGEVSIFEALGAELAGALERLDLLDELVLERAHLFDIVDRSSDAIFTIDGDGIVETWNPAMEQMTGYSADELGHRGLAQIRPHDHEGNEVRFEDFVDADVDGPPGDVEILTRSGQHRWLACSYGATTKGPTRLVVVARDVTHQREVERLKDDFVATVSHELQTPLTTIMGFTDLLLTAGDTLPPAEQLEALGIIKKGSRRLGRLISNLLELSLVEATGQSSEASRLDVNQLCTDVLTELRDSWPNRDIDFRPGGGAVVALGNQLSIEQILGNLVGNALKYAPNSPVTVVVDERPGSVSIRVVDEGPGIPAAHLERIFDRFERLDHNHVQAGTGLGLYISRQLAKAMNGTLTVASEPGRGSTFTLELPAEVHLIAVS